MIKQKDADPGMARVELLNQLKSFVHHTRYQQILDHSTAALRAMLAYYNAPVSERTDGYKSVAGHYFEHVTRYP